MMKRRIAESEARLTRAMECDQLGRALSDLYAELHLGKYTKQTLQREKYESLLKPLHQLVRNQNNFPPPLADSTGIFYDGESEERAGKAAELGLDSDDLFASALHTATKGELTGKQRDYDDGGGGGGGSASRGNTSSRALLSNMAARYLEGLDGRHEPFKFDTTFGVRFVKGAPFIGCKRIHVQEGSLVLEGDSSAYRETPGLWELLLIDKPTVFTPDDEHAYEDIVLRSYVYKRNNDPHNP